MCLDRNATSSLILTAERASSSHFSSLVELLLTRSTDTPTGLAFLFVTNATTITHQLTYGDIADRASATASRLRSIADAGSRVLLVYDSGPDFVVVFFACLLAHLVPVPINPPRSTSTWERTTAIVRDSGAHIAFTDDTLLEPILLHPACGQDIKSLRWYSVESLLRNAEPSILISAQPDGDSLAFLQYTSGSTARPRGVKVTHGNLLHNLAVIQEAFALSATSINVTWLPVFHDMGLIGGVLQGIYAGYTTIMMPQFEFVAQPIRWLRAIDHFGATISGGPNFAYALCSDRISEQDIESLDLHSWTLAYSGAEIIYPETLDRFSAKFSQAGFRFEAFYPCYGLAESTLFVTGGTRGVPHIGTFSGKALRAGVVERQTPSAADTIRITSCGRPHCGQCIAIVDSVTHAMLPEGKVGEIWTAGQSVAPGYWTAGGDSEVFNVAIVNDPNDTRYLRTGDLGFVDGGELFVAGRHKDLIKLRGHNYFPEDIELTATRAHPALRLGFLLATSISIGEEERCIIVAELGRESLRAVHGSGFVRAAVQSFVSERSINDLHQIPTNVQVPLQLFGLPSTFIEGTWVSIRPILRSTPSRDQLIARVDRSEVTSHYAVPFAATSKTLLQSIGTARAPENPTANSFVPLASIASAVRETVASQSRVAIEATLFVLPGSIPKTSSGKLRRAACRDALVTNKLELLADITLDTLPKSGHTQGVADDGH